jgi:hypothetical protein
MRRTPSASRETLVPLTVPIRIHDELTEVVIHASGTLDLATGEIHDVRYDVDRPGPLGLPATADDYEFTSGTLESDGKEVEFRVDVDAMAARYYVSANELLELKLRAAKLFAGLDGRDLAAGAGRRS